MAFRAALFDLDGVLIRTDILHFRSWQMVTAEEGIPFDREVNNRLLGVSRQASLEIILERAPRSYSEEEKKALAERKNRYFLEMVQKLSGDDLLPGARALLSDLERHQVLTAVCSSSKNARRLVELLALQSYFQALVDGNDITHPKPHPEVFLLAADRLQVAPGECLVLEDAEAGVRAARNAGMKVLGVGDGARLRAADLVVGSLCEVDYHRLARRFAA